MPSSKPLVSKEQRRHRVRRKVALAAIGIKAAYFDDDDDDDDLLGASVPATESKCGAARHCDQCDPFAADRERELVGIERGTKLCTHRARLIERIRRATYSERHLRATRRKAKEFAGRGMALKRVRQNATTAFKWIAAAVRESRLEDEADALAWLHDLQQQVHRRVRIRELACRRTGAKYRNLSGLVQEASLSSDVLQEVDRCVQLAAHEVKKKALAYEYVGLLLIELGLFSRTDKPDRHRLGKRTAAALSRRGHTDRSVPYHQFAAAMATINSSTSHAIAKGESRAASTPGLPSASSPRLPTAIKWRVRIESSRRARSQR